MRHSSAPGATQPDTTAVQPTTTFREATIDDLPVVERRDDLAGIPTVVLEGGEGPPVVLLHGPGEFAALWGRVVPQLTETHRVVVPDLPGHGATGRPTDGPLDAERWLAWLRDLVARTCTRPPALVGHLAGGALALRHAIEGGPVERIVLVDSAGLAFSRPAPSFATPLAGFLAHPTERSRDRFLGRCMYDFDGMRTEMGSRWDPFAGYVLDGMRAPGTRSAVLSFVMALGMRPIRRRDLARIPVPVSMIWGRHDLQNRLRIAESAAARFGWPLEVIEDVRDDPCWERPEAAVAALRGALARPLRRHLPA
ncbi:pimeloyl-ACP methyl ester carboxylesterase [Blastococcus colisei]|uniref:Pimeloyl-ACP methyl ester carboxylesterase n=1 Tax=Blastococcus colisei TaxID=1564162 RepID=A0A543PJW8_9ACTN|nr:alpha/beta hydrolase [Blastococcus colisei]TQN44366.1 pimeloyl-ACP methyl ester carboxylesterase [Blastococcus colisei]